MYKICLNIPMVMIIKNGLGETCIKSINDTHNDNYGCCPLDNYENIS